MEGHRTLVQWKGRAREARWAGRACGRGTRMKWGARARGCPGVETGRASVRRVASFAGSSQGTPALSTPEMTVGQQESGLRTGRCRSCNPAEVLRQYELISKDPSLNRCPKLGPPTGFVGLGGHSRKTVPGQSGAACADPRAVFLCFCYADVFSETLLIYCFHCLWYLSFSF